MKFLLLVILFFGQVSFASRVPDITLATNLDNTSSTAVVVKQGGTYMLSIESDTWGGGGAILQKKTSNGKWVGVFGSYATADTYVEGLELAAGEYRINAVTAINVYAYLNLVRPY